MNTKSDPAFQGRFHPAIELDAMSTPPCGVESIKTLTCNNEHVLSVILDKGFTHAMRNDPHLGQAMAPRELAAKGQMSSVGGQITFVQWSHR